MSFDGIYLHKIKQELSACAGEKLERISQPSRESLMLTLRGKKLLIMAGGATPKLHFTTAAPENPAAPPMFCMLLRKHLGAGRFAGAEQLGLDRVLRLDFDCRNEFGDLVRLCLWCELMGRRSNVVLTEQGGRIIDALRRVDFVDSETRQILPNMIYAPPPAQDKADIRSLSVEEAVQRITSGPALPLSKAVVAAFMGFSPVPAREISHRVCGGADIPAGSLGPDHLERLAEALAMAKAALEEGGGAPFGVFGDGRVGEQGEPLEFCVFPLTHYPESCPTRSYASFSELLDSFYRDRDAAEGIRRRKGELLRTLSATAERLHRKLAARKQEQLQSENRETLRQWGDIVSANMSNIQKGQQSLTAENFYGEAGERVTIPLDPKLSPSGNAQKYYNDYRRAASAHRLLAGLIEQAEREIDYIESVRHAAGRAATGPELAELTRELAEQGYLKRALRGKKPPKPAALPYLEYRSDDGFTILCGRNNYQNDTLTHKVAQGGDLWLHLQKAPGSHVIVLCEGREIPDRTIEQAAVIAAVNSSAASAGKVAVDYIPARKVKKPNGAKPGFAVYNGYQTAYVAPDQKLAERLKAGKSR